MSFRNIYFVDISRIGASTWVVKGRWRVRQSLGQWCRTLSFMRDVYRQLRAGLRLDWGPVGADAISSDNGCMVVVDVLSFTTSVSIATSRGMAVLPYRWKDETAKPFARDNDAALAVGRSEMTEEHPWSLSPASLMTAPFVERLVLPSPNGSTIAAAGKGVVVAACLRNAKAVAQWILQQGYGTAERPVAVVAAGERWTTDDSLRPSIEDLIGAGYVLSELDKSGCIPSPEAALAINTYRSIDNIPDIIRKSASGLELIEDGYAQDVETAITINTDRTIPVLQQGRFVTRE